MKFEQERGHVASVVESYMHEYGVSREETLEKLKIMISDAWKDINEDWMKPTAVSTHILLRPINIPRLMNILYDKQDGVSFPASCKDKIIALYVDPIPI